MSQHRDVIVVGLGDTGSAAAQRLAERGARVLGLDQRPRPHDREAGQTRMLRTTHPEQSSYVPLLARAWELWRHLERASGLELLRVTGGLVIGTGGGRLVGEAVRTLDQWGAPVEVLGAHDITRSLPAYRADSDDLAVRDPWAGHVRAGAAVAAQVRQARRRGADLRFGERVVSWDSRGSGRGVRVDTESGVYVADQLVVCAGTGASRLLPELGLDIRVRRHPLARLRPGADAAGDALVCVWEDARGDRISVWPTDSGSGHLASLTPASPTEDEQSGDGWFGDHVARRLSGWVGARLPAPLVSAGTADGHPVVGTHPHHDGVHLACGLPGKGAALVPVVGEVLADLVLQASTIHPVELFAPQRYSAVDVTGSVA